MKHDIFLKTGAEHVGTFQGDFQLPKGVQDFSFSFSRFPHFYWIEEPSAKDGTVHFSGIFPGGIRPLGTSELYLFSIEWPGEDTSAVPTIDSKVYASSIDAQLLSRDRLFMKDAVLPAKEQASLSELESASTVTIDPTSKQLFLQVPTIASGQTEIYIKESPFSAWTPLESPYALRSNFWPLWIQLKDMKTGETETSLYRFHGALLMLTVLIVFGLGYYFKWKKPVG